MISTSRPVEVLSRAVHVLIVEDSEADAALIEWELARAGLHPLTQRVETESELAAALGESAWDVVICDYRLPGFNAPAALQLVKAFGPDVPFIVISGKIGEDAAVEMMRSGAQDYLMKDNLARLGPAVERELRDAANRVGRRREAEHLTKTRALYEAAAIHMTDGLMIADPSDRVVFLNPRMEEFICVPAVDAAGRSLWDVADNFYSRTSRPAETRRLSEAARDAALAGRTSTFECRVNGEQPRDLVVFAFPIRGPEGEILGHGKLARDVTREREVDRLKDDFVSMISHELRTPMNGVIAMTDLLLESHLDDDQRECAEIVRDSGNALVAIVNNILDVSHFQAGKLELEHAEVDVRAVVEHVVDLLVAPARKKGVELVGLVDRAVPYLLYGDPGRLLQVLTNLVGNAVKFTKRGDVSVQIRVTEDIVCDVVLRCEVIDTGIGADVRTIERLFEPFSQADSSVTRRYGGTGLGLTICKRLVDAWGGEIGVSTQPGAGSTFWFTVGLEKPTAEVAPRLTPAMRNLRVLILDPHVTRRAALGELLAGWGVAAETCGTSEAALEALQLSPAGQQFAVALVTSSADPAEAKAFAGRLQAVYGDGDEGPPIVQLIASAHPTPGAEDGGWPSLSSPPHQSQLLELLAALVDRKPDALHRLTSRKQPVAHLPPSRPVSEHAPRVLVVDDSEVNRRVAERMLRRLGYRTESGDSGMVAVSLLSLGSYAAVLMDCRMPDMDGITATAEIRREERGGRRTPIIAMTANSQRGDRERCLAAGMDDYLAKPVQIAEMERVLAQWISSSPANTLMWTSVDASGPDGVLDPEVLAQLRAFEEPGEASLLTELIQAFRSSAPGHIARLKAALAAGDAEAFEDAAHVLKGSAATLGAARVRTTAYDLELRGRNRNLVEAHPHLQALEAACTEALEALSREEVRSGQESSA